jgi:lipoteichoic acid synthase
MSINLFKNINFRLLLFYFLTAICAAISIEILQYNIMQNETSAFTLIIRKFRSLFDACMLMLPFFLMNKRKWIIFILLFLLDIFCLSQIWYFRTYQTLMPFSSYFLFDNVSELLIKSIIGSIHPADIWVILPTILLLFLYLGFYKNNTEAYEPLPKRIAYGAMIFIICSFGYLATPLKAAIIKDPNRPSPWIRWTASFGPSFYVEANGLVPYFVYTLTKATTTSKKITPEEKNYIDRFILSKEKKQMHNTILDHPRKNLIIIIVESLNSWLLNRTIDGIEITPNLNRFIKEDSGYFGFAYSSPSKRRQIKRRTSYDQYGNSTSAIRSSGNNLQNKTFSIISRCPKTLWLL